MIVTDMIGMPVYCQNVLCVVRAINSDDYCTFLLQDGEKFFWCRLGDITPAIDRPISMAAATTLNATTSQPRALSYIKRIWAKMLETWVEGNSVKYYYAKTAERMQDEIDSND